MEVNKTKSIYKRFLSYAQIKRYLPMLLESNLAIREDGGKYRTTRRY